MGHDKGKRTVGDGLREIVGTDISLLMGKERAINFYVQCWRKMGKYVQLK